MTLLENLKLENLKGRPKAPAPTVPTAPAVLIQLDEAKAELAGVQAGYDAVAFTSLEEGTEGSRRLADLDSNITQARKKVENLEAAHRGAVAHDEKLDRERKASRRLEKMEAVKRNLGARLKAADEFSAAIELAVKHLRVLYEKSELAHINKPDGIAWPGGSLYEHDEVRRLVAAEMFRLGTVLPPGRIQPDGFELPAPQCPAGSWPTSPASIPKLRDKLVDANEHVIKTLTKAITG